MANSSNNSQKSNSSSSSSSRICHKKRKVKVKRSKTEKTKIPSQSKRVKGANTTSPLPITFVDWRTTMVNLRTSTMAQTPSCSSFSPCFVCVVPVRTPSRSGDYSTGGWTTCFARTTDCYTPSWPTTFSPWRTRWWSYMPCVIRCYQRWGHLTWFCTLVRRQWCLVRSSGPTIASATVMGNRVRSSSGRGMWSRRCLWCSTCTLALDPFVR